jgi:hypothetical protein
MTPRPDPYTRAANRSGQMLPPAIPLAKTVAGSDRRGEAVRQGIDKPSIKVLSSHRVKVPSSLRVKGDQMVRLVVKVIYKSLHLFLESTCNSNTIIRQSLRIRIYSGGFQRSRLMVETSPTGPEVDLMSEVRHLGLLIYNNLFRSLERWLEPMGNVNDQL